MKPTTAAVLLITAVILLAACSPAPSSDTNQDASAPTVAPGTPGTYQTLSIDALADIVENVPANYTILNVHIPYAGEIAATDANIKPIDQHGSSGQVLILCVLFICFYIYIYNCVLGEYQNISDGKVFCNRVI